jgi:hypothetical protein
MSYPDVNGIDPYWATPSAARPPRAPRSSIRTWCGGSDVAEITAAVTHYDLFAPPDLATAVIPFLDAPSLEPPAPFTP